MKSQFELIELLSTIPACCLHPTDLKPSEQSETVFFTVKGRRYIVDETIKVSEYVDGFVNQNRRTDLLSQLIYHHSEMEIAWRFLDASLPKANPGLS